MELKRINAMLSEAVDSFMEGSQSGFSVDSDKWFDMVADNPAKDDPGAQELDKISRGKPTKLAFEKFENAIRKTKAPWKKAVLGFVENMKSGKYKKEFGKFDGEHSQVSELFSLFRQAFDY